MTLRGGYELGFTLAATFALLAVLLGGEMPVVMWAALASPFASVWMQRHRWSVPASIGTTLAVASLGWGIVVILDRGTGASLLGGGIALVGVLVARLLTRTTLAHDLQVLVIGLILVFAGAGLHTQFTFAPVFVGYAISTVWALLTRELVAGAEREAEREDGASYYDTLARKDVVTPAFFGVTAMVAVLILASTLLLFIAFPRIGLGNISFLARNRSLLPSEVSLVGDPRASYGGGNVVARVTGLDENHFEEGLYLRGPVYAEVDGRGFSRPVDPFSDSAAGLPLAPVGRQVRYSVFTQPLGMRHLLTLGPMIAARTLAGGFANPSYSNRLVTMNKAGALMAVMPPTGPIRYEVVGDVLSASRVQRTAERSIRIKPAQAAGLARYLELPPELLEAVQPLVTQLTQGETSDLGKVVKIRRFFENEFTYTLDQPNAGRENPVEAFLFANRQGHCEYFATAFAVLLRAAGIPSRVVGGFQGGAWDDESNVAVFTGEHAHTWTEWFSPRVGWVLDDATPGAEGAGLRFAGFAALLEKMRRYWDERVLDYGLAEQIALARDMTQAFRGDEDRSGSVMGRIPKLLRRGAPFLIGVLVLVVLWVLRRPARGGVDMPKLARALLWSMEQLEGTPTPSSMTLREAVRRQKEALPVGSGSAALRQVLGDGLQFYEEARFGGRRGEQARAARLARQVRRETAQYLKITARAKS